MKWWPFINGRHLRSGVDLKKMFATLGHEQTMDIVDSILVEDTLEDAKHDGVLTKIRTAVKKQYATIESSSGEPSVVYEPPVYTEQTEDGYVGLPPPLG